MDDLQGRLRRVLDPVGYGIPRRAVLSASSRMVVDKSRAVDEVEIGSISEVCSILFNTEPRHPADLLRRAFTHLHDSTWQALRDDIVWGYPFTLQLEHVGDIVRVLLACPDECRAFVCLKLVVGTQTPELWDGLMESFVDISGHIATIDSEVVVHAFRDLLTFLNVSRQTLSDMVMRYPQTVKLLRHTDILGVYDCDHIVVNKVLEYARTLSAPQRMGPLVFLAVLVQHSILPQGAAALGVETLVELKRARYDVQIAAAASVLAQCEESSAVVAGLAAVIESLATTLQKSTT